MSRIVFTLTAAQVRALVSIKGNAKNRPGSYGTADGLVQRKLAERFQVKPKGSYYSETRYRLTKAGAHARGVAVALGLDKVAASEEVES